MMRINKNGMYVNKWESVSPADNDLIYEFALPPGIIRKFLLDKLIDAFAVVQSYQGDYLYVNSNPTYVHRQLRQICGKRFKYYCTVIQQNEEVKKATANF